MSYCLKCKKKYRKYKIRVPNISNGKTILLSKCAIYGSEKSRFIKKQEASGILSSLNLRTLLSKVPLLGDILFQMQL